MQILKPFMHFQFFFGTPVFLGTPSIFGTPICSKSFEGLVLKILVEGTVLYLMIVYRPDGFDSERHFCTNSKSFAIKETY